MSSLIFDFDGTICDDFEEFTVVINHLSSKYDYPRTPPERIEGMRDKSARELLRDLGIPVWKLPLIAADARQLLRPKVPAMNPIPGIAEALRELKERNVPLTILTSNSQENVRLFLTRHDLNIFSEIRTGSSLFGKGRLLRRLVAELDHHREPFYYIGDEARDIEAARKANTKAVAVTWGFNSRRALVAAKPDHLLDTPSQLISLVP